MRKRSEKEQDFQTIRQNLYAAGISTVKAAKAHEDMFTTTLEALSEAYEMMNETSPASEPPAFSSAQAVDQDYDADQANLAILVNRLMADRKAALERHDYDNYVAVEQRIQHLDELVVLRLERHARLIRAQKELRQLAQHPEESVGLEATATDSPHPQWTEVNLKKKYKTLKNLCAELGTNVRTWKEAVKLANSASYKNTI